MKRKIYTFFTFLLTVVTFACFLVSCNKGGETKAKLESSTAEQIVIKIEETDGEANAFDALKSLRNQDLISFDYTESTYGAYVTSINGKAEQVIESTMTSAKGYSWALYTSDTEYAYTDSTVTYGETVCGKSAMGASSVTVKKGAIYIWVYEYYEYTF